MNDEIIEAAEGVEDESTEGIPEPLDHAEVLARFQLASDAWGDIYRDVLKFSRFAAGDQWERKDPSKIQLTYNIVPSFVRYVSNNVNILNNSNGFQMFIVKIRFHITVISRNKSFKPIPCFWLF
jgi:hypothetical protein